MPLDTELLDSRFRTLAVHEGSEPSRSTGDIVPPIHIASTHVQDGVEALRGGYEYRRVSNPTRDAFASALAALEGGASGFAFPSGLSAEDTLLRALTRPGSHVSFGRDVYGGTFRLLRRVLRAEGVASTPLDLKDLRAVEDELASSRSTVLWVETPSNPLLEVVDIAALAEVAHAAGALLVVDNTFATPYLQRPLEFGADAVIHSTTKYIGGHSDVIGGAIVLAEGLGLPAGIDPWSETGLLADEIAFLQATVGAVESPRDAHLLHRGLKTLAVRMERHSASAQEIAEHLEGREDVLEVHYPGLAGHPGHDLAARQMRGFGGVLSFRVGDPSLARAIVESTGVFALAVSLGAVESLIEYPAVMTHGSKSGSEEAVPADLVRLAVGLEDVPVLIEDLDSAFARAKEAVRSR